VIQESRLDALVDQLTITDLIYRYCRAVDRLDIPLGHSIWHDDAIADYGADFYQGNGRGAIDHSCEQHRRTLHPSHQVSNILIDLDGDRAGSEAYAIASLLAIRDFDEMREVTPLQHHNIGRRDRSDPSYSVLEPNS
jgi:hypothetical protein